MNNNVFDKLVNKAGEMAINNHWGENAYKINMKILEIDPDNSAACTRLAKYYKLNGDFSEARKMYFKALEINPNSQGAINNLVEIDKYLEEKAFMDKLTTGRESYDAGRALAQNRKYGLSIKCFLKAYRIEPLLKYAVTLAKTYKKLGKYEELNKLYKHLLDSNQIQSTDSINAEFVALLQR